jgi:hypothetical protein
LSISIFVISRYFINVQRKIWGGIHVTLFIPFLTGGLDSAERSTAVPIFSHILTFVDL